MRVHGIDSASDLSPAEPERRLLAQQNIELRRRLEEEHQNYKRKLSTYQEGQRKQAQLVHKLQIKVVQYKKRCSELELLTEQQRNESIRARPSASKSTALTLESDGNPTNGVGGDQDVASIMLDEEKQK